VVIVDRFGREGIECLTSKSQCIRHVDKNISSYPDIPGSARILENSSCGSRATRGQLTSDLRCARREIGVCNRLGWL
jgi:hypothetical protein